MPGPYETGGRQMWMNVLDYIRLRYGLAPDAEPTKAQYNSVYNALREGTIPGTKQGRRWFVKMEVTNARK